MNEQKTKNRRTYDGKRDEDEERIINVNLTNESVDVARRTFELSETIIEAVDHLITRLSEGSLEVGTAMLDVIGDGLESIEKTIPVLFNEKNMDADICEECFDYFSRASEAFDDMANAAVRGDIDELLDSSDRLKKAYSAWVAVVKMYIRNISLM
ncbi:MAG: hypothetical protein FWH55_07710 [Oscillospiraceae bacterium]|nr:hypothetical protein [Oscillospiraceae bacterium]